MTRALSQHLSYAELIPVGSFEEAFELLVADEVDAVATSRTTALDSADRLPGSRVLEDRFGAFLFALGVPRGRAAGLAYLTAFAEEAKSSEFLAASLERYGTRGLSVAPATEPLVR